MPCPPQAILPRYAMKQTLSGCLMLGPARFLGVEDQALRAHVVEQALADTGAARPVERGIGHPVKRHIDIAVLQMAGDIREARAEYEAIHPVAVIGDGVHEMQKHARIASPPLFLPAVARTYRGMLSEIGLPLHALPRKPSVAALDSALRDAYRECALVRVTEGAEAALVRIEDDAGTDRITLRVSGNGETGQARLTATYDNLGKGAAGAAVQNLNIMAGNDPVSGLTV